MADERNRWLDGAAAERVLRGAPAGPDADRHARDAELRLRAALDMLVPPQAPAGTELPGEEAALAAFRAARAGAPDAADTRAAGSAGSAPEVGPVVDLGPVIPLPAPRAGAAASSRRGRPVRFALAAALASVAVGGIAAAAGAGLLDRATHTSAGPAPAATLSAEAKPAPSGGVGPTSAPQLRPDPLRSADGGTTAPGTPDGSAAGPGTADGGGTGPDSRFGPGTDTSSGTASAGGTGGVGKETLGGGATELRGQDRETRLKAVDLCEAYRSGSMTADRRDKLSKLAKGLSRIPHYCEALLDGPRGSTTGTAPRSTEGSGEVLKAPTPGRAAPMTQPTPVVGTASPGVRVPR
ncbi:hypothetical protein ACSHWO_13655 [Streptomyces sp. HUAS TT3]|uniref:hypothetical protein n=1 Tax=Streptomyces sp. HUAS TT3 TaxID=3447510 RepID=UPI003F659320